MDKVYIVKHAASPPDLDGAWESRSWAAAEVVEIAQFHPRSSDHRPRVQARLLYDRSGISVFFRVADRYVRSVATRYLDCVCTDSCVECFLEPKSGAGYFNFEANGGGTFLIYYIEDPARTPGGFRKYTPVRADLAAAMPVRHSLPATVDPELPGPVEWTLRYTIPWALFEAYVGPLGPVAGQVWRGNFFKCADATSHPHWAAWAAIGEELNFHQPRYFGEIRFAEGTAADGFA